MRVLRGQAAAFRHPDGEQPDAGQVWILWAVAGTGTAQVELPAIRERVTVVQVDGSESVTEAPGHRLVVELEGDRKMAPPVIIADRIIPTATEASTRAAPTTQKVRGQRSEVRGQEARARRRYAARK